MAPNLMLLGLHLCQPYQWVKSKSRKNRTYYSTTPVPGIYSEDRQGERYLIAIKPNGKKDVEGIFRHSPKEDSLVNLIKPEAQSSHISTPESGNSSIIYLPLLINNSEQPLLVRSTSDMHEKESKHDERVSESVHNLNDLCTKEPKAFWKCVRNEVYDTDAASSFGSWTSEAPIYSNEGYFPLGLTSRPTDRGLVQEQASAKASTLSSSKLPDNPSVSDSINSSRRNNAICFSAPSRVSHATCYQHPLSKKSWKWTKSNKRMLSSIDLPGYKVLAKPIRIEYNHILSSWRFSDEIAARKMIITGCQDYDCSRGARGACKRPVKQEWIALDDAQTWVLTNEVVKQVRHRLLGKRRRKKSGFSNEMLFRAEYEDNGEENDEGEPRMRYLDEVEELSARLRLGEETGRFVCPYDGKEEKNEWMKIVRYFAEDRLKTV